MSIPRTFLVVAVCVVAAAGCGSASYDERMDYLRTTAQRGVDTYKLLYSQEVKIDKARCERAYAGLGGTDMPSVGVTNQDPAYIAWRDQVKEFFVDSCLSGKPKPVPGDLPHPGDVSPSLSRTPSPSVSLTPSPSVMPSASASPTPS